MHVTLLPGDCLALLRTLPTASVDACVTDPPYELGFMGQGWDRTGIANNVTFWREVARVLKPGGHVLAFGGTRTYHRMACAIEDAGLEIRDSLHWIYGSGFPKSHDVSKALDKAAGAERPDAIKGGHRGINVHGDPPNANALGTRIPHEVNGGAHSRGTPATDLAQQWAGWGTALKPAHEPIVLARKPLAGTVAATVAAYGTGALNIDASRVQTTDDLNGGTYSGGVHKGQVYGLPGCKRLNPEDYEQPAGRWPPNVLLTHAPGCVPAGTRQVKGTSQASGLTDTPARSWKNKSKAGINRTGYAAPDGTETVAAWVCAPGCPVAALDAQSGERKAGGAKDCRGQEHGFMSPRQSTRTQEYASYGDTGGASRFYPVFTPDPPAPFIYCPKASRRERNAGCAGLPEQAAHRYSDKAQGPLPQQTPTQNTPEGNHHPCVKPQRLMEWLCTLITPPGGTILDPFCGSGSTGVAAVTLGYDFIGYEQDAAYMEIARARIAHAQAQQPAAVQPALEMTA